MRVIVGLIACAVISGCAETGGNMGAARCGTFFERCPAPPDSGLVNAIAAAWALELDPLLATQGPFIKGPGGDSAWTVAVYRKLEKLRPPLFVPAADTAHATHLSGIAVEMLGDTARVTTSTTQCTTRQTTYNWTESGLAHKFIPYRGKWALLPGSLAHVADGKC